ncbi:MAG: hypothetical protein Q4G47_08265, partial [Lachnospiraceae bacterium]|nr:hypothetical protein [Lachnospiraceae bacterium]
MKKALIFLTALLIFAVPCSAEEDYAESTAESSVSEAEAEDTKGMTPDDPVVYTYEDDVNMDYYSGMWVDTGAGLKVWLPDYWEQKELSDEAKALGIVFKCGESGGMSLTLTSSKIPRAARPYELT